MPNASAPHSDIPLLAQLLLSSREHPDLFAETPFSHLLLTSAKIESYWQTLNPRPYNITARQLIEGAGVTPRRLGAVLTLMGWQAKQITRTDGAGKMTKRRVYAPPEAQAGALPPNLRGKLKSQKN
jgi:hypothetical protein